MTITRSAVLTVLDHRCGAFLTEARKMTGDPTKPNEEQCIGWAVRLLGYTTASLTDCVDGDLSPIPDAKADALLDLAELRTLESVQTNLTQVSSTTGPLRDEWNDLSKRLADIIGHKRANIAAQHGISLDKPLDGGRRRAYMRAL
jgi:hypothetical protein